MDKKSAKVIEFEKFVNEKLKTDLKLVLDEQDAIYTEIAEYLQVKDTVEKLQTVNKKQDKEELKTFKTRVDLGCNFYANAVVENASRIFVSIGYGFFLEMKFDEALKFIDKKVKLLNEQADDLTNKASEIKANIKFVLEGLREIQNLEFNKPNEEKNSLFV